mgnify:FL=1
MKCNLGLCNLYIKRNTGFVPSQGEEAIYMLFVDMETAFDTVLWQVIEWSLRKDVPKIIVRVVMKDHRPESDWNWAIRGISLKSVFTED